MSEALRSPPALAPASQAAVLREGKCPWSGGVCSPAVSTSSLEKDLEPARDPLSSATMQARMVRSVPQQFALSTGISDSCPAGSSALRSANQDSSLQADTCKCRLSQGPRWKPSCAYPASEAKSTERPDPHVVMALTEKGPQGPGCQAADLQRFLW